MTLFLRNTQSVVSEHVSQGSLLRFVQIAIDDIPGYESEPSSSAFTGTSAGGSVGARCTSIPIPTPPRPVSPVSARRATSPIPTKAVLGNPAGNVGIKTEKTTRGGS